MMDWTDAVMARLELMWNDGVPTSEIGVRLGCTKSAVVGKAHRMQLPVRPSPINPNPKPRQPERVHRARVTLPPLASVPREPRAKQLPPPSAPAPPPVFRAGEPCCWPLGEPGSKTFRYCDAPTVRGKPYCPEHCAGAFVKIRDRREDVGIAA